MSNLRSLINLVESLADWSGDWVHYSRHPMMSMNPNPGHRDPVGIYLFPSDFQPIAFWQKMPFRFSAKIDPSARILDISLATQGNLDALIEATGIRAEYDTYLAQFPKDTVIKRFDMAWEVMQSSLGSNAARWNKLLRSAGWDAIFDDQRVIHSREVQMLVLDPRIMRATGLTTSKPNAFKEVQTALERLRVVCEPYGQIEIDPPRRERRYGELRIEASLRVTGAADSYASFVVAHSLSPDSREVSVYLRYSRPSLSYGVGTTFHTTTGKFDDENLTRLTNDLERIFKKDEAAAA
jgi:hypothetical protein